MFSILKILLEYFNGCLRITILLLGEAACGLNGEVAYFVGQLVS